MTLNEKLRAIREAGNAKRPPAITAIMQRATQELRDSGIMDRVVPVDAQAPLFARPNLTGDTVRLRTVLRSGPVVLSFFRGRW